MNFKITFASQDETFPLELGEVTARIVPADPDLQDKTVTPTESTQTVTCDAPHDGLGTVTVNRIPSEYVIPEGTVTIDHNGVSDVAGYASADVHVSPVLQRKSITPTRAAQTVEPDSGKDGLSAVEVGGIPSEYVIPEGTVNLSSNGQHDVSGKAVAVVDVQPVLQSKSITPTRAAQTVTPDSGKDGLSAVEVGGIPSEYVIPTGTKQIAANGTHDVSGFASAEVAVPGPSGQIEITENGEVDVSAFASALVAVPQPTVPTQEKTVTPGIAPLTVLPDDGMLLASVMVGSSKYVHGKFNYDSSGIKRIDLGYVGDGYPVAAFLTLSTNGKADWAGLTDAQKYHVIQLHTVLKFSPDVAPKYVGSTSVSASDPDLTYAWVFYRSSKTSATTKNTTTSAAYAYRAQGPALSYEAGQMAFINARFMDVNIALGTYGFATGIEYDYYVIYSE